VAKAPGIYELATSSGTYPIAVNVDWSESPRASTRAEPAVQDDVSAGAFETSLRSVWRIAAALGLLLLVAEGVAYHRPELLRWRL
jgi:hypothetical protein